MKKFEWPEVDVTMIACEAIMDVSLDGVDCADDSGQGCPSDE